jgi:hypothetical protein
MEVIFEPEPDVPESERGTIASQIQRLLKEKIGLRMKVSAEEKNGSNTG